MKKSNRIINLAGIPGFSLILAFLAATVIHSCNGGKKEDKPEQPAPGSGSTIKPAEAIQSAGPFAVLKLSAADLKALLPQGGPAKKLLIQFSDNGGYFMSAVAFNAKANGEYDGVMKELTQAGTAGWDTTGVKILGNNEITTKQLVTLLGGPIKDKAVDLYFYPKKDANNQIYYVVSKTLISFSQEAKTLSASEYPTDGFDTKPSPPAPPCSSCE